MQISKFNSTAQCLKRVPSGPFRLRNLHIPHNLHNHPIQYSFTSRTFSVRCNTLSVQSVEAARHLTNEKNAAAYEPSVWGDYFIGHSLPSMEKPKQWVEQRRRELKEEVREMLRINMENIKILNLVDTIEHLGVAYHFEKEIDDALTYLHCTNLEIHDVHDTALRFRLLRQHGFPVSSDEFCKFKDDRGNFDIELCEDVRGLLSLYNAGYLAIPGEVVLDDSISFAKERLQQKVDSLTSPLKKQVLRALKTPLHRMMPRVEARFFIDEYEEMRRGSNDVLLEFAKLDFNFLQSLHFEEMRVLSLWWKELNLEETLRYARDRVIECYFWALGLYFEPQHSVARIIITKYYMLLTVMDDTFDRYGTYEECKLLTDALQMWDEKAIDQLPMYLKGLYLGIVNTLNGFEHELEPSEKYRLSYLIETMQSVSRTYMEEVEWSAKGYVPTFNDCQRVSIDEQACIVGSSIGMGPLVSEDAFRRLTKIPDVLRDASMISRYIEDIVGFEREKEATTLNSYMMEYNMTKEAAVANFQSFTEEGWKRVNEACLRPTDVPMPVLARILNFIRVMEVLYYHVGDGFNKCSHMKELVASHLLKPISL